MDKRLGARQTVVRLVVPEINDRIWWLAFGFHDLLTASPGAWEINDGWHAIKCGLHSRVRRDYHGRSEKTPKARINRQGGFGATYACAYQAGDSYPCFISLILL